MTKLYSIKGLQVLAICLSLLINSSIQAQVPSYVPTDGLVGYWPFNGNANDESGNGNDGTVNGATLTADRFGMDNKSFNFQNNEIVIQENPLFGIVQNGEFSIAIWLNKEGNQSVMHCIGKRSLYSPYFSWQIAYNSSIFFQSGTAPNETIGVNSTSDLLNDTWTFVIGIYNNSTWDIYINGELNNSGVGLANMDDLSNLTFGNSGGFEGFYGSLDDIGIWNRALTETEIQALYVGCNVAPTTIAGSVNPFTLTSSDYACNNNPGSTYEWTITNGVITAGQGTSNVTVLWGEEGAGTLTVLETNTEGCSGTPATIEVMIECATTATTLDGPLGPNALTATTYTCNGAANSTFEWTISNGVITSGQGTNTVTVLWAGTGFGSISVQETTNANCMGDLISINVVVIPTAIDELNQSNLFLYPNPANDEITLQTNQSSIGSLYIIVDQTGKQIASGKITGTNTTIKLDQFASGMYTIIRDGKTSQQFQVIK